MDIESNKKQNKKMTIFACFLSVLSIGLLIFGFSLVSSDKVVMLQSISNLTNKLNYLLEDNSSLLDKLSTSKDIGIRSNLQISSNDTSAQFSFDYLENKEDKKSKLLLNLSMNDEKLLDADLALSDSNIYFFIEDITPNYYSTALEYFSILSGLSSNDYDKLFSLLKESVTDSIDNQDIKKEKVKISYHGKDKKVNKLTYGITNETIKNIATTFINSVKNDKMLLGNIALYLQKSEEDILVQFDEFLDSLNYDEIETEYYYRVYYYGFNQIISYELEEVETNTVVEYKIDQKEIINCYQNDQNLFSIEVAKNKNQYDFEGFIINDDGQKYTFTGNLSENVITIIFNQGEMDIKIVITSSKEEKENNYYYKNQIVVSTVIENEESNLFTLNIDYEYYFNQKANIDIINSIDISEITEEDMTTIQNNIMNHPIYQLIMGLSDSIGFSL